MYLGTITGSWKYKMFKLQRKFENDLWNKFNQAKNEDENAMGLYDERLGYIPIDLHVALIRDNRRILESILGGYSKGNDDNLTFLRKLRKMKDLMP